MNTHIIYYKIPRHGPSYFCGIYPIEINEEGFYDVQWKWTQRIEDATHMNSADAWDLWSIARKEWPDCRFEVQRMKTFEEVSTGINRSAMDI